MSLIKNKTINNAQSINNQDNLKNIFSLTAISKSNIIEIASFLVQNRTIFLLLVIFLSKNHKY